MTDLRIAPIVEGHGDEASVRILLDRVWREIVGGTYLEVLRPIRVSRSLVIRETELLRSVDLAHLKLTTNPPEGSAPGAVLLMVDADPDLGCEIGPELLRIAREGRPHVDVICAFPDPEYETWFVAAAESLGDFLDIDAREIPQDPDRSRNGKGWIQSVFRGPSYSETVEQPRMTDAMDLRKARRRSRSFDKLCRELEARRSERR